MMMMILTMMIMMMIIMMTTFPGWGLAPGPPPSCLHPGTSQPTSPTEGGYEDDDDGDGDEGEFDDDDDIAPWDLTAHLPK